MFAVCLMLISSHSIYVEFSWNLLQRLIYYWPVLWVLTVRVHAVSAFIASLIMDTIAHLSFGWFCENVLRSEQCCLIFLMKLPKLLAYLGVSGIIWRIWNIWCVCCYDWFIPQTICVAFFLNESSAFSLFHKNLLGKIIKSICNKS